MKTLSKSLDIIQTSSLTYLYDVKQYQDLLWFPSALICFIHLVFLLDLKGALMSPLCTLYPPFVTWRSPCGFNVLQQKIFFNQII